jgi:L-amino acid N-acyltransferase YncA
MKLRDATPRDAVAIAAIYGPYVQTSTFSFEGIPPDADEMTTRMKKIAEAGLPYLVAESEGRVAGYAYASAFHTRSAYRFTVENSVYVAPQSTRAGTGTLLMRRLIAECAGRGLRQMIARIGDGENIASIALHEKLGFRRIGELRGVGFKFGRWVDVVEMQLVLGPQRPA